MLNIYLGYMRINVARILGRECSVQSHFLCNIYANESAPVQIFIYLQILENGL